MEAHTIRVVVFRRGETWVAQCLDFDLATQARTVDDLDYEIQALLVGHVVASLKENKRPFESLPKAPSVFWRMFDQARSLESKRQTFDISPEALRVAPIPELRLANGV